MMATGLLTELSDGTYRLETKRGSSIEPIVLTFEASDFQEGETDISDYTFKLQMRKKKTDNSEYFTLIIGRGITITLPVTATINLSDALMYIEGGSYFFDLNVTTGAGRRYTMLETSVTVKDTVTRW